MAGGCCTGQKNRSHIGPWPPVGRFIEGNRPPSQHCRVSCSSVEKTAELSAEPGFRTLCGQITCLQSTRFHSARSRGQPWAEWAGPSGKGCWCQRRCTPHLLPTPTPARHRPPAASYLPANPRSQHLETVCNFYNKTCLGSEATKAKPEKRRRDRTRARPCAGPSLSSILPRVHPRGQLFDTWPRPF